MLSAMDNKPIERVAITCNLIFKAYSDIDGKFSIVVDQDADLSFFHTEFEEIQVNVEGRQKVKVLMSDKVLQIPDIVVSTKAKIKTITVEPADIEIKGNYFHLKTKFRVPYNKMKSDYRFVVQPTVHDVTNNVHHNLRPVVIDGRNYDIVEHRHLRFGKVVDSLERFVVPNTITKENDIYPYKDSLYISSNNLSNDFKSDCYLTLVSYWRSQNWEDDVKVITISKGTVNPLRLFEYEIRPMQLDGTLLEEGEEPYLTPRGADTIYIPTPEMELRNSVGTTKITFGINRSTIDLTNAENRSNIDHIQDVLREIYNNPDATLNAISMIGHASPDGTYVKNQELANLRTKQVMDVVSSILSPSQLKYIDMKYESIVEPWSDLIELTAKDNPSLSAKIAKIIEQTNDDYAKSQQLITALPEYRNLIRTKYLPMLRRVEYRIDYSVFRSLTIEEIKHMYIAGDTLSRHEFYTLVTEESDPIQREEFKAKAIEIYPNFTIFVNHEAVDLIERDSSDMDILAPLFSSGDDTPMAVRYNQSIMALRNRELAVADSLSQNIIVNDNTLHLHNVVRLLNGEYEETYEYFKAQGGLNEVLLLLSMRRNQEAFDTMKALIETTDGSDNANYHYVYAMCANRIDDMMIAMAHLQIAITMNPSLCDIAKIDSDVIDMYDLIRTDTEHTPLYE